MQTFTTGQLRERLKASAEAGEAEKVSAAADRIDFLEFTDLDKAVKDEVEFVRAHPLILKETEVTGWVYHVESGKVRGRGCERSTLLTCAVTGSTRGLALECTLNVALNYQTGSDGTQKRIERSTSRLLPCSMDDSHRSAMCCSRVAAKGTSASRMTGAKPNGPCPRSIAVGGYQTRWGRDIRRSTKVVIGFTSDYKS